MTASRRRLARFWWQKIRRYDGEICEDCGCPVARHIGTYWSASEHIWVMVMGDVQTVVCPDCFARRAEAREVAICWAAFHREIGKSWERDRALRRR